MIERSNNPERIKALATHPAIFPFIADDFFPDPAEWEAPASDLFIALIARDPEGDFGFGIFHPRNWSCYEAHLGFLPRSYGHPAVAAFSDMLDWMWTHTKAARIVGEICQENRRAIRFAVRSGFTQYGVNPQSSLRGGVYRDQVCLGISRP